MPMHFSLRVTEIARDGSITTWPTAGPTIDQQGLPAERLAVPVLATTAPPSLPSVDSHRAAVAEVESHGYRVADISTYQPAAQLHVLIAVKMAAPDAGARLAFFFLGATYRGTDTATPSANLGVVGHDSTSATPRYALYRPTDDVCCPSGGAATVRYHWNGEQLVPQDPIPTDASDAPASRR